MPAACAPLGPVLGAQLRGLGDAIRARRKALGVSATTTAEAADLSRVTLHRVEKGEPAVTMGAYLRVMDALGMGVNLKAPQEDQTPSPLPTTIQVMDYPQLRQLLWQRKGVTELTPQEALDLYERNWRHVDHSAMDPKEHDLVNRLVKTIGGGRLLV